MADPVTVTLDSLQSGTVDFTTLESAFGPDSLGIILVSNLPPTFPALRLRLLTFASLLGNLPAQELAALECPEAKYLVGWSCGKEKLANDRPDTAKGSYYVNCAFYKDRSLDGAEGGEKYGDLREYTEGNIWPREEFLEGFRETFMELCTLIIDTAGLVARACDRYAVAKIPNYTPGYLEHVVATSTTTKARLLHYFPLPPSMTPTAPDSWCGTHLDHSCLTGLTSAMYTSSASPNTEIPCPDPNAGLYIQDRNGNTVKVAIPKDCLAFQTGEALEVITKGRFKAVPHFVRGCEVGGVARGTLAVFTQPNLWEMVGENDFAMFAREIVGRNTNEG
ncbi:uncharacterized protein LAJ45_05709 [Morchella importuna]|uniref:Clavaminate synthase-like protein n=1 Tax=Morchella conica CCBAS932 TaxID=1392247 RepID=A0A3N4KC73_9PEZI|nr:uncharacterized protein LAJ45_05709 [Morchella importuna]KAH8150023.1 hypothetical protein LAJ45_05709 [Morchella importuna]RPB08134.1 Clavaminate synthase-like protein [Morchella conica CCBAS932]